MLQTHSPHTEVCYSTVVKQLDKSLDDVFKGEYHKEKIVGELSSKVSMEFLEVTVHIQDKTGRSAKALSLQSSRYILL